jgi:hypothetical protein
VTWVILNLVSVRLEMVLVSVQDRCMVCGKCTIGSGIVLDATRLKWKLILVCLEIVLILTQDRCTISAKHTMGSQIVLDAPDGIPR